MYMPTYICRQFKWRTHTHTFDMPCVLRVDFNILCICICMLIGRHINRGLRLILVINNFHTHAHTIKAAVIAEGIASGNVSISITTSWALSVVHSTYLAIKHNSYLKNARNGCWKFCRNLIGLCPGVAHKCVILITMLYIISICILYTSINFIYFYWEFFFIIIFHLILFICNYPCTAI